MRHSRRVQGDQPDSDMFENKEPQRRHDILSSGETGFCKMKEAYLKSVRCPIGEASNEGDSRRAPTVDTARQAGVCRCLEMHSITDFLFDADKNGIQLVGSTRTWYRKQGSIPYYKQLGIKQSSH